MRFTWCLFSLSSNADTYISFKKASHTFSNLILNNSTPNPALFSSTTKQMKDLERCFTFCSDPFFHPPSPVHNLFKPKKKKKNREGEKPPPSYLLKISPFSPSRGVCIFLNAFQSDACSLWYWFSATAHNIDLQPASPFSEGKKIMSWKGNFEFSCLFLSSLLFHPWQLNLEMLRVGFVLNFFSYCNDLGSFLFCFLEWFGENFAFV